MREIKFRFWDGELLIYIDDWIEEIKNMKSRQFGNELIVNTLNLPSIQTILNNQNGVWMQYIGIKDKKEKDIYEGDIVRVKYKEYAPDGETINENYVKGFIKKGFCSFEICTGYFKEKPVVSGLISEMNIIGDKWDDEWEVIGNIYENPELL